MFLFIWLDFPLFYSELVCVNVNVIHCWFTTFRATARSLSRRIVRSLHKERDTSKPLNILISRYKTFFSMSTRTCSNHSNYHQKSKRMTRIASCMRFVNRLKFYLVPFEIRYFATEIWFCTAIVYVHISADSYFIFFY